MKPSACSYTTTLLGLRPHCLLLLLEHLFLRQQHGQQVVVLSKAIGCQFDCTVVAKSLPYLHVKMWSGERVKEGMWRVYVVYDDTATALKDKDQGMASAYLTRSSPERKQPTCLKKHRRVLPTPSVRVGTVLIRRE